MVYNISSSSCIQKSRSYIKKMACTIHQKIESLIPKKYGSGNHLFCIAQIYISEFSDHSFVWKGVQDKSKQANSISRKSAWLYQLATITVIETVETIRRLESHTWNSSRIQLFLKSKSNGTYNREAGTSPWHPLRSHFAYMGMVNIDLETPLKYQKVSW